VLQAKMKEWREEAAKKAAVAGDGQLNSCFGVRAQGTLQLLLTIQSRGHRRGEGEQGREEEEVNN
jgi:hypothetical protein